MKASEANPKQVYLFEKAGYLSAIFKLGFPSILGQLILVIYNLADTFFIATASGFDYFVSSGLSNALVAGVTICMPVFMLLSAISNLFGIGAASVMSRSMGQLNYEKARNSTRFAFWSCLFTTLIYSLLVLLLIDPLTNFLSGNDPIVAEYAKTYITTTVVIFGIPTALNTLLSHLFRGEGKSLHASTGIVLGGVLNCILDPIFMFVIFDIKDAALAAALATGISNAIALIYYLVLYLKTKNKLVISFKFKTKMFNEGVPSECLLMGLPAFLMTLCENISYMVLDNLVGTALSDSVLNTAALAGIGSAKKLNMVAHSTVRGMTQGVLPIIGYNKSSGNRHRMRMLVYISGGISLGIALLCAAVALAFSTPISTIFLKETQALEFGSIFFVILAIGAPFSAVAYTAISFFQAVGKAWRSLILSLLRKGILDIPLMFLIPVITNQPLYGIVAATPVADMICCIVAIILFSYYISHHGHDRNAKKRYSNSEIIGN